MPQTSAAFNSPKRPIEGLNQIRFLAALLVFTQHSLSSCHLDDMIDVAGFRIGRIGTAIFFLLSGFLSASTTREPLTWFKDRLCMLFPAYWIVTLTGFFLAAVTGTKTFDAWQVVSQLAGTGYFTHGDHIVNLATWFMSPLLLLYAATAVARLVSTRLLIPVMAGACVFAAVNTQSEYSTVRCHMATFFLAFAVANVRSQHRLSAAILMAGAMLTFTAFDSEFRYGTVATVLLIPALQVQRRVAVCNWFTGFAYEWFLVHGLCLAAVNHLTSNVIVIVAGSGLLSIVCSIGLKHGVRMLNSSLVTFWTGTSQENTGKPKTGTPHTGMQKVETRNPVAQNTRVQNAGTMKSPTRYSGAMEALRTRAARSGILRFRRVDQQTKSVPSHSSGESSEVVHKPGNRSDSRPELDEVVAR